MQPDLAQFRHALLEQTVQRALHRSAETLTEMSGVEITISASAVKRVALAQLALAVGQPDEPAVGVYVGIEGDGAGYLLLLLDEGMAADLAALLLGVEPGAIRVEDELAASALAEAGNVSCSAFMNALSEATGLTLMATPPVVVGDMRGAIMDIAVADIAQSGDEALLISTHLRRSDVSGDAAGVHARLLAIPTPATLETILDRLGSRAMTVAEA